MTVEQVDAFEHELLTEYTADLRVLMPLIREWRAFKAYDNINALHTRPLPAEELANVQAEMDADKRGETT